MSSKITDEQILIWLKAGRESVIDYLFQQYYSMICIAVYRIFPDKNYAEDIAQEVFYEIWKRRSELQINSSLGAYMRKMAVNKTLNFIRDKKLNFEADQEYIVEHAQPQIVTHQLEAEELKLIIDKTIDKLPERCRIVFILNRYENMPYKEIAKHLNISVKTVENQISKALKILRQNLGPYLGILSILFGLVI